MLVYICQTNAFYVLVTGNLFLIDSSNRYWSFAAFALQSFVEFNPVLEKYLQEEKPLNM